MQVIKPECVTSAYLALEVGAFVLHAAGGEQNISMLVFLDDGEALTIGPEDTLTSTNRFKSKRGQHYGCFWPIIIYYYYD